MGCHHMKKELTFKRRRPDSISETLIWRIRPAVSRDLRERTAEATTNM
jgi:hypothetical protein